MSAQQPVTQHKKDNTSVGQISRHISCCCQELEICPTDAQTFAFAGREGRVNWAAHHINITS